MSRFDEPQYEPLLEKVRAQRYGACARASYPYAARSLLRYLERRGWSLATVNARTARSILKLAAVEGLAATVSEAVPAHARGGDPDAAASALRTLAAADAGEELPGASGPRDHRGV
jgi:hypothetical protein